MKLINEKGKLFGVINVVDLLVLLAVIAVAAGVGYKLFAPQIAEAGGEAGRYDHDRACARRDAVPC